jgi:hypothetical protein
MRNRFVSVLSAEVRSVKFNIGDLVKSVSNHGEVRVVGRVVEGLLSTDLYLARCDVLAGKP